MNLVSQKAGDKKTLFEKAGIILSPVLLTVTLISYLGASVFGVFGYSKNLREDIDSLVTFKEEISSVLKETKETYKVSINTLDNRIDIADTNIKNVQSNLDRLSDRLTNNEKKIDTYEKVIKEIQASLNNQTILVTQQSGDIKVIREILQRVEKANK